VCQAKARRRPAAKSANPPLLLAWLLLSLVVALISRAEARLLRANTNCTLTCFQHLNIILIHVGEQVPSAYMRTPVPAHMPTRAHNAVYTRKGIL
jgi:hypothetical protein